MIFSCMEIIRNSRKQLRIVFGNKKTLWRVFFLTRTEKRKIPAEARLRERGPSKPSHRRRPCRCSREDKPMTSYFADFVNFVGAHPHYALCAVFLLALSEAIPVIGTVVPGSTLIVSSISKGMSHELGAVKRREFRLELARIEVQRISPAEKHAIFPKEVSCTLRDKYIWLNKVDYHSRGQKLYKEIASFLRWSIRFINVQTFRHRQYGSYKLYCTIASDSGARNFFAIAFRSDD
jgi:hypothetical protein